MVRKREPNSPSTRRGGTAKAAKTRKRTSRTSPQPRTGLTPADLAELLTPIARKGLPATFATASERLLGLPDVLAYSAQPESRTSRLGALTDVLEELLEQAEHQYAAAARRLFALDQELRGKTLEHRDTLAAMMVDVSPGHFRQRVRQEVIKAVAEDLFAHARRYQSSTRSPRAQRITGKRPVLNLDSLTSEQELIARIWQHLYGWRAEMIAAVRRATSRTRRDEFEHHAALALREYGWLHQAKTDWIDQFGQQRISAGADAYDVEGVIRLAAWTALPDNETTIVRLAAVRTASGGLAAFISSLRRSGAGRTVIKRWQTELRALARAARANARKKQT